MLTTIAEALLPVFFVLILGFFCGKRKIVSNTDIGSLNTLVMMVALPISLFTSIASTDRSVIVHNWWLAVVLALTMIIAFLLILWMEQKFFGLSLGDAAVQALTSSFPNYASVGLPLMGAVWGEKVQLSVAVAIATGSVTVSPLTLALLERHKAIQAGQESSGVGGFFKALGGSVRKPIFIGPVLGLIYSVAGFPMPDLLVSTLKQIGGVAAGVALFLTGLILSAQVIKVTGNVLISTLMKAVAQPLIGLLVVFVLQVPDPYASQALLLLTIPAGFFGILFGLGAGVRPAVSGSTLVLSSVVSIATLSIAIALLA